MKSIVLRIHLNDHRARLARTAALGLMLGTLAACNRADFMDSMSGLGLSKSKTSADETLNAKPIVNTAILKQGTYALSAKPVRTSTADSVGRNSDAIHEAFKPNREFYRTTAEIAGELSPRCRKTLADAGIESARLRSPVVSMDVNDQGDFGLGASYDLVDWKRASLQEELALAQCARDAAGIKLTQLAVTSAQSLSRAGYLSAAGSLNRSRKTFARIERNIQNSLYNGDITILNATTLRQNIENVLAEEARLRGEASKRIVFSRMLQRSYKNLDLQLLDAEQRIHDVEARMRTANAIKFRASASYGRTSDSESDLSRATSGSRDDFTGKLQLAVRLGSFTNRRHDLEEISRDARIGSYYEKEAGGLWRISEQAKANQRALNSLMRQRQDVRRGLAEARRNANKTASAYEPDLVTARLRAKIDVEAYKARLAGLDATIADTRRVNSRLRFKR